MVKHALEAAKSIETPEVSVETQFISLAQKNVRGCLNCRGCVRTGKCVLKDDWDELFRPLYDPMPDGVIFGASVYFYGINSQMRAYMERATSLLKANFFPEATTKAPDWSKCVGASIAVGYDRNGGRRSAGVCRRELDERDNGLQGGAVAQGVDRRAQCRRGQRTVPGDRGELGV